MPAFEQYFNLKREDWNFDWDFTMESFIESSHRQHFHALVHKLFRKRVRVAPRQEYEERCERKILSQLAKYESYWSDEDIKRLLRYSSSLGSLFPDRFHNCIRLEDFFLYIVLGFFPTDYDSRRDRLFAIQDLKVDFESHKSEILDTFLSCDDQTFDILIELMETGDWNSFYSSLDLPDPLRDPVKSIGWTILRHIVGVNLGDFPIEDPRRFLSIFSFDFTSSIRDQFDDYCRCGSIVIFRRFGHLPTNYEKIKDKPFILYGTFLDNRGYTIEELEKSVKSIGNHIFFERPEKPSTLFGEFDYRDMTSIVPSLRREGKCRNNIDVYACYKKIKRRSLEDQIRYAEILETREFEQVEEDNFFRSILKRLGVRKMMASGKTEDIDSLIIRYCSLLSDLVKSSLA